jgi:excisionase family DNA binding protein
MDILAELDAIEGTELSTAQVARLLGVTQHTVAMWCRHHKLQSRHLKNHYRIPKTAVLQMLRIPPSPGIMTKPFLTVTEAARLLRINTWTMRYWVRTGKVPSRRIGYKYELSQRTVNMLLEEFQERYQGKDDGDRIFDAE